MRHVERWLQARNRVVRAVWRLLVSPILLILALRKPFQAFAESVGNEVWPWVLAWSGWRVRKGTLEVWQVPPYLAFCASLPARLPWMAARAWWKQE